MNSQKKITVRPYISNDLGNLQGLHNHWKQYQDVALSEIDKSKPMPTFTITFQTDAWKQVKYELSCYRCDYVR